MKLTLTKNNRKRLREAVSAVVEDASGNRQLDLLDGYLDTLVDSLLPDFEDVLNERIKYCAIWSHGKNPFDSVHFNFASTEAEALKLVPKDRAVFNIIERTKEE